MTNIFQLIDDWWLTSNIGYWLDLTIVCVAFVCLLLIVLEWLSDTLD